MEGYLLIKNIKVLSAERQKGRKKRPYETRLLCAPRKKRNCSYYTYFIRHIESHRFSSASGHNINCYSVVWVICLSHRALRCSSVVVNQAHALSVVCEVVGRFISALSAFL